MAPNTRLSFLLFDDDWLGYINARRAEISADLRAVFPGQGAIQVVDGRVVASRDAGAAIDDFDAALAQMTAGLAAIDRAEHRYAERTRMLLVQMEPMHSVVARWLATLWSATERADFRRDEAIRRSEKVDPKVELRRFHLDSATAAAQASSGAQRAGAWLVQTYIASLMTGRAPCTATTEAALALPRALTPRHSTPNRTIVASAAGQSMRLAISQPPRQLPPRFDLAWPGDIGGEFPRTVDDPVAFAAQTRAYAVELTHDGDCTLEIADCNVRMPLSEAGKTAMRRFLNMFGRPRRGREDTLMLTHAGVPKGVENIRAVRIPTGVDRFSLHVSLRYPQQTDEADAPANAAERLMKIVS